MGKQQDRRKYVRNVGKTVMGQLKIRADDFSARTGDLARLVEARCGELVFVSIQGWSDETLGKVAACQNEAIDLRCYESFRNSIDYHEFHRFPLIALAASAILVAITAHVRAAHMARDLMSMPASAFRGLRQAHSVSPQRCGTCGTSPCSCQSDPTTAHMEDPRDVHIPLPVASRPDRMKG